MNITTFPSSYASDEEKGTEEYGRKVFRAIIGSTGGYRKALLKDKALARQFAEGKQSMKKYLDEVRIEGNKQYININFTPNKIIQKFKKIVVDDYQQMTERLKVESTSTHIQVRKEKKKSDLEFAYEFKDLLQGMEQETGVTLSEDGYPEDRDELDLINSLDPPEREEILMSTAINKVFEDNDLESLKRLFLTELFDVGFAGFHTYIDRNGEYRIEFVPIESAIYGRSTMENFKDSPYQGKRVVKTIGEIRDIFNITPDKEDKLYELAKRHSGQHGNGTLVGSFDVNYLNPNIPRPYDDFSVNIYHIFFKTLNTIRYIEGSTEDGEDIFDVLPEDVKVRPDGEVRSQVAYEGWFAGEEDKDCLVLQWGKSKNMLREGYDFEKLESPYTFFMPDNKGNMNTESPVELVIPDIEMMDLMNLKIKVTLANHPPQGYAVDLESLMEIDLGYGEVTPMDIESIFNQTGRFYFRRTDSEGIGQAPNPVIPLNLSIQETINTYITNYNIALNNVRETLGINQNRDGTANLSRVSNSIAQTQMNVSQTATYYLYRGYLKTGQLLAKKIGIGTWMALKFGKENKGLLRYLGRENYDFIKERDELTATDYKYSLNPQMTAEDKERLNVLIQQGLTSGDLKIEDALLIDSLEDIRLAEKYVRYYSRKNAREAREAEDERQRNQTEQQTDMAIKTEEAKRETFTQQTNLQKQEWEVKGKNEKDVEAFKLVSKLITNQQEGMEIPEEYKNFINLVIENYTLKQEKSLVETEAEIIQEQQEEEAMMREQEIVEAVERGDITEEEAMAELGG